MRKAWIRKVMMVTAAVFMTVIFAAAGCAGTQASATEAEWSITIKDASGNTAEFTNEDAGSMEMVEVDATLEKKDGSTIEENWKGIPLSDVLNSVGAGDYTRVSIQANDGYSQEYEASAVDDPGTILGFFQDGQEVSAGEGLVQLVVPSMTGKYWIKNVAVIEVVE